MALSLGWQFVKDLVVLSRPVASLFAGAEVIAGALLARFPGHPSADGTVLVQAGIAIFLTTAAVNAVNDIRDIHADAISQPTRPLPAGRLSVSVAWLVAGAQGLAALALSTDVPVGGPEVILLLLLIGTVYSYLLKGTVLVGNCVVALLAASPVLYGAWVVGGRRLLPLLGALIVFSFMFSYEVLKTIRDVVADSSVGYQTVAARWGVHAATMVYRSALTSYAVTAALPMLLASVSIYYIVFMCLGAIPSLVAGLRMPVDRSAASVRQVLRVMAISWLPGFLALALATGGLHA